ncbi:MAG: hypothetical protein ACPG7F_06130 [Aggregatilineales bacterium]
MPKSDKPTVVCLCGSTRFSDAYQQANLEETLAGKIVLTIGCDMRSDTALFADKTDAELTDIKARLDQLHLRKIDLADEVLILNVGGYIGPSTRNELQYAQQQGKLIRWLEPPAEQTDEPITAYLASVESGSNGFWIGVFSTIEKAIHAIQNHAGEQQDALIWDSLLPISNMTRADAPDGTQYWLTAFELDKQLLPIGQHDSI